MAKKKTEEKRPPETEIRSLRAKLAHARSLTHAHWQRYVACRDENHELRQKSTALEGRVLSLQKDLEQIKGRHCQSCSRLVCHVQKKVEQIDTLIQELYKISNEVEWWRRG